jgi:hypothetical protein
MIRCSLPSSGTARPSEGLACASQGQSVPTWLGRAAAGSASKDCLTPLALYLSTKLPSLGIWSAPTVGANAENASLAMFRWGTWNLGVDRLSVWPVAVGVGDR